MNTLPSLPAMDILLADDNDANCLVARTILERAGHRVVTARNGDEALNLTKCAAFDLIILDILMPVMNGLSALQRIRQENSQNQNIPIFALMAYGDNEDRQRYFYAGFNAILSKPLRTGDLEDAFSRYKRQSEPLLIGTFETPASDSVPVLDQTKAYQFTDGVPQDGLGDTQSRLWRSIRNQCEKIKNVLPSALEGNERNLSEFRRAVHAIKVASASIRLTEVTEISRRLRNAPPSQIPDLVRALIYALSESPLALQQALSGTRQLNPAMQMSREDQPESAHHSHNDGATVRN